MTRDEARTNDGTTCSCLDDGWGVGATDDRRSWGVRIPYREDTSFQPLACFIALTGYCRYRGNLFRISPDPLPSALPCLPASYVPPTLGRGTSLFSSIRTRPATTQSACFQSPCPLTHSLSFVRYRHDVCLLTERTTERRTERETRTRNGTRDGTKSGTSKNLKQILIRQRRSAII